MARQKIVVCGATGNQGGAVARFLVAHGSYEVIGLSRNLSSPASLGLKALGIKMILGDPMDGASLEKCFEDATAVFGVTQPWSSDYKKCDVKKELKQAENIIGACKTAGVKHLVMSSILNPWGAKTGAPHVDSKLMIEQMVENSTLPYTIIRLPQFMDNIGSQFFPVKGNKIKGFIAAAAKVPYIACKDIGPAVLEILTHPGDFLFRKVSLIGDFISGNELADALSELRGGVPCSYVAVPKIVLSLFAREFYHMRTMFERMGYSPYPAEIVDVLTNSRSATTFKSYLQERGYGQIRH